MERNLTTIGTVVDLNTLPYTTSTGGEPPDLINICNIANAGATSKYLLLFLEMFPSEQTYNFRLKKSKCPFIELLICELIFQFADKI